MIVDKEFIKKIKDFGLNSYEAKLWTALLSRGISTAGELSDIANVPRSRAYDILESLEKKGFVVMKIGKPIKYLAVPPKEVLERVKKNIKKYSDEKIKRLDTLKENDVLDELNSLHTQGIDLVEPSDLSGSLKGRHNLYNHFELIIRGAEKTVTIVTTEQGLVRKIDSLKPVFEQIKKRGVKIRILAPITKENKKAVEDLKGLAEIKNTKTKARFIIVDSKEIIFMIMDDKDVHPNYDVGIWINTPYFASAVEELFELAWKNLKK